MDIIEYWNRLARSGLVNHVKTAEAKYNISDGWYILVDDNWHDVLCEVSHKREKDFFLRLSGKDEFV